jgi:peptide/nickel transport system permease protein
MARYLVGRIFGLIIVFLIVSVVAFLMMHSVPGGPFDEEKQPLPPAAKANILRKYGLDKPLYEQYLLYMGSALHGDFGISFQSPTETVTELIGRTWPISIQLGGMAILVAFTTGLTAGVIAAIKQLDRLRCAVCLDAGDHCAELRGSDLAAPHIRGAAALASNWRLAGQRR